MNKQLAEAAKRENVLVLRLSAREQELQDVAAVAVKYRQQQVSLSHISTESGSFSVQASGATLRKTMLDPAINHLFSKMKTELKETKEKLDSAQSELSAWKFTPDSQTGKQLMNRVRTLIQVRNLFLFRNILKGLFRKIKNSENSCRQETCQFSNQNYKCR